MEDTENANGRTDGDHYSQRAPEQPTPELTDRQLFMLGLLVRKQLTQHASYPLTLNATARICARQPRLNRQPVQDREVQQDANVLASHGLITIDHSGRSERYAHNLTSTLSLQNNELALLSVLLTHGPCRASQISELVEPMYAFENLNAMCQVLYQHRLFRNELRHSGSAIEIFHHNLEQILMSISVCYLPPPVMHRHAISV